MLMPIKNKDFPGESMSASMSTVTLRETTNNHDEHVM